MKAPKCSENGCFAPKTACCRGETVLDDCEFWAKTNKREVVSNSERNTDHNRLPWSGAALGTADLRFFTARSDPALVAILGSYNAGKTTLLGSWYILLGRVGQVQAKLFAGSYSLEGWEAIAHSLRWESERPTFPPHTSSRTGRAPGLLHMAFRNEAGRLEDVLFSDAPGEWFQRWAVESEAPEASGARWLAEKASTLIVVADCESLAGQGRGTARSGMISLLRRVASVRKGRPVALVWAKADVEVSETLRSAVRNAALLVMPDIVEFPVSVIDFEFEGEQFDAAASLIKLLEWSITPVSRGVDSFEMPLESADPFFAMGMKE